MRHCHRCGLLIPSDWDVIEIAQFATSGARPTLYLHKTVSQCHSAQRAAGVPLSQLVRR